MYGFLEYRQVRFQEIINSLITFALARKYPFSNSFTYFLSCIQTIHPMVSALKEQQHLPDHPACFLLLRHTKPRNGASTKPAQNITSGTAGSARSWNAAFEGRS